MSNRRPPRLVTSAAAAGILASALVAGCANQPPTRSGGADRPVSLKITAFTSNANTPETTDEFRRRAEAAGKGSITFHRLPNVEALETRVPDPSSDLIKQVRDGTVDVGVVASRSFDLIGVHSLQALNAPLTVDNPDQAVRLLADPVTTKMLAGLSKVGLVGLVASWGQLRQPLGYGKAIRTPADLRGAFVIGRNSQSTKDLFASLGATLHLQSNAADAASVTSGEADVAELSFDHPLGQVSGPQGRPSYAMANVEISILANVIIVNAKTWASLSTAQQHALRTAAVATRDWAGSQATTLAAARDRFCRERLGNVAVASPTELAAWRTAVAPFVQSLRSADPATAAALDRAAAIVADHPSTDVPAPCTMAAPRDDELKAQGDQSVVSGVWRVTVHADRLAAAGATDEEVRLNSGTWTFTFKADGTYGYVEPRGRTCSGKFAVNGTSLVMKEEGASCDGWWRFTFIRTSDKLAVVPTADFAAEWSATKAFFSEPWSRLGEAPAQ